MAENGGNAARGDDEAGDLAGMRVLLAEDDLVSRLIAQAALEHWGIEVTPVPDGLAAVRRARAGALAGAPFDLLLMDLHMPRMDGLHATIELRQSFAPDVLPIIGLSAAPDEDRIRCLRAGMNDFIRKPFELAVLSAALRRWAGRSK